MDYLTFNKPLFCSILFLFLTEISSSQEVSIVVSQDNQLEEIMAEKRKTNMSITSNKRYKVQLFSGNSESAKKILSEFRKENSSLDGTIVFNTPNYKVWIGNFKTRIEAERNLKEIKKNYPNSLLIKPSNY